MRSWSLTAVVCSVLLAGCAEDRRPPTTTIPSPPAAQHPLWCPDTRSPIAPRAGARLDARAIVGLSQRDAQARAQQAGCAVRVVSVDGEGRPVTDDYSPQRINVSVLDGRVATVDGIG